MRVRAWWIAAAIAGLSACGETGGGGDGADAGLAGQCDDAVDNDGDGRVDLDDPDCQSADDPSEGGDRADGGAPDPQCANGRDDDGDGRIDGADRGCQGAGDDDESDDPALPACHNGVDDDGDGQIDFPADRGCASNLDDDEADDPAPAQCANGLDDDADGVSDFPGDLGCGSPEDDDESGEMAPLPQCGDGLDNDGDGRIDGADPGCGSAADPREQDGDEVPACSNGLDDDGDGIVDFPGEPGCSSAGDEDEADPAQPPACGNGLDDDGDDAVDFPFDPGCQGVGDRDESDPPVEPQCADGRDNDRDGQTDFPADNGCESAADGSELGSCGERYQPVNLEAGRTIRADSNGAPFGAEGSCGGRGAPEAVFFYRAVEPLDALIVRTDGEGNELETAIYVRRGCLDAGTEVACAREPFGEGTAANRLEIPDVDAGDYYIFVDGAAGRGGRFALTIEEVPTAACRNLRDDDGDGRADFPVDPGCRDPDDRDETDPEVPPLCADDADNDGDGLVDFPLDQGCRSAADDDEVDLCGAGIRFDLYPVDQPFVLGNLEMEGSNNFNGSCGGANAREKVFLYENRVNARLTISVLHDETTAPTVVYVRRACADVGSQLGCDAGQQGQPGVPARGRLRLDRVSPGDYFIFVDAAFGNGGPFKLSVDVERLPPGCSDGVDGDGDGVIDGDDVGCSAPDDEDERDPDAMELAGVLCDNGMDDDGDGHVDYPEDPGCATRGDTDEADPAEAPACANGVDDDEDDLVDFPADIGCEARGDDEERNPNPPPACSNRIDDDRDNRTDFPNDPGCVAPGDRSEADPRVRPACLNGEDDDRDGVLDFPFEPGCASSADTSEDDPVDPAACSNRADDDMDGRTDFPRDPGCEFAGDDDETDGRFAPQCGNGMDDDRDGRTDFPDDPGCRFAADPEETDQGPLAPRCSDGVDNDDDGAIDLADVGCEGVRDNDEIDLDVEPYCADGIDNDEDGIVDWPEDRGCAARGDLCEQPGYGLCDGECTDLVANELHCGRCNRACDAGVQCIDGRCGSLREVVMRCGGSARPVQQFLVGELADAELRVADGCAPDDTVQALLITRGGINEARQRAALIRDYVSEGGNVITEYNISDDVYNALFNAQVPQGGNNGNCQDNVQPAVQFSPQDPFWIDNVFVPVPAGQAGCGFDISRIPGLVPLGGWNANAVSLGYVELDAGRLWLVEADWQDSEQAFSDISRQLMAYMIAGGGAGGRLPPCLDGRDNDEDGDVDAEDTGCAADDDEAEGEPPPGAPPACGNGLDDDGDGAVDFPNDPGCVAAGDTDEADPDVVPACHNGLDDDGDGRPDYPLDPGCLGRGDREERDPPRRPGCGNNRDDDEDGRTDYPADPGCVAAGDQDEADDPAIPPACANRLDDDGDGVADWPFDRGCEAAIDGDEADPALAPACANGEDDDGDGVIDFPADWGCAWAADPTEENRGEAPACANAVDDDGDGQIDFPRDRGCSFAAESDETGDADRPPACGDGIDNDGDRLADLADPGCRNREDGDEADGEAAECANGRDDDEDGLVDWPADPGCQARGDGPEVQACGADAPLIERNGTVRGATVEGGADGFRSLCGGRDAPDAVFKYVLERPALLEIAADEAGTDFPVVLSVRRDCEEPLSELTCTGNRRRPEPRIALEQAQPGEYYIFVDGAGQSVLGSSGAPIAMPAEPREWVVRQDLNANGWSDGGNDAFDGYGQLRVSHGGVEQQLDSSAGQRDYNVGAYSFRMVSEFAAQNVWRVRLLPTVEGDEREVTFTLTGNLGSDGATVAQRPMVNVQGFPYTYLYTTDNIPSDPPVTHFVVPGDPEQRDRVRYDINVDNPTVVARDVKLPITMYVGISYAAADQVIAAIARDLVFEGGAGGPDAASFGNFQITVTER